MQTDKVISFIKSQKNGFFLIEIKTDAQSENIENSLKNIFFQKQYEIDTSFFSIKPEDSSKSVSIEQIRKIKKEFLHTNVLDLHKIIYLNEINLLNNNSINALLKITEEVPQKTYFIFCSQNLLKVPDTILSRARIIRIEETISNVTNNLQDLINYTIDQNQNISDDIITSIVSPFISLKESDFFESLKIFDKNNLKVPSEIFLKILSFYLNQSLNNQKLFRYLIKLHSDFIYDLDESIKFNTLTNDLIAIYFTRLNSNLIKYGK
jgi:DNA polymerase III delta prime subunit